MMKIHRLSIAAILATVVFFGFTSAVATQKEKEDFLTEEQIINLSATLKVGQELGNLPGFSWKRWAQKDGSVIFTHGITDINASGNRLPALFITLDRDGKVRSFTFVFRRLLAEGKPLPVPGSYVRKLETDFGNWHYYFLLGGNMADQGKYSDQYIIDWMFGKDPLGGPGGYFNRDYLKNKPVFQSREHNPTPLASGFFLALFYIF